MTDPETVVAKALLRHAQGCEQTYPLPCRFCDCVTDSGLHGALLYAEREAAAVIAALREAGHLT